MLETVYYHMLQADKKKKMNLSILLPKSLLPPEFHPLINKATAKGQLKQLGCKIRIHT